MSGQTYPDPAVKRVVNEHFEFIEIDANREKRAADWLGVEGLPDAIILSVDGKILDRKDGFVEPAEFQAWLKKWSK